MQQLRQLSLMYDPASGAFSVVDEATRVALVNLTFSRIVPIEESDQVYIANVVKQALESDSYIHHTCNESFGKFGSDA